MGAQSQPPPSFGLWKAQHYSVTVSIAYTPTEQTDALATSSLVHRCDLPPVPQKSSSMDKIWFWRLRTSGTGALTWQCSWAAGSQVLLLAVFHTCPTRLEESSLFLQLVPLPQCQPVEIFHAHPKHLGKLFWGKVALNTNGKKLCYFISAIPNTSVDLSTKGMLILFYLFIHFGYTLFFLNSPVLHLHGNGV